MSLITLNYGLVCSFKKCTIHNKMGSQEERVSDSSNELSMRTHVSRWSTCGELSAMAGGDLSRSARILNGSWWNGIARRNLLLSRPRDKTYIIRSGASLRTLPEIRDSSLATVSLDMRKDQRRKRGRKGPGLNAKDVHVSTGYWRLFGVGVPLKKDLGKDHFSLSDTLLEAIATALKCHAAQLSHSSFSVVRKSLDARKDPRFVYTIDLDVENFLLKDSGAKAILSKLRAVPGKTEFSPKRRNPLDLVARLQDLKAYSNQSAGDGQLEVNFSCASLSHRGIVSNSQELLSTSSGSRGWTSNGKKSKVVVVGSGPAGLFAALTLAETGMEVVLLERGQPVETRGCDIGALMVRRLLDPNSNLCYGEGGAGTWSDGKLTTRIGKNSDSVQTVLATLVRFGAPPQILVDGKPHVGTDKLVRIVQNLRFHLLELGVNIMFGTTMQDLEVHSGRVTGVRVSSVNGKWNGFCGDLLEADAVVLGVGHSARDVYDRLLHHNVLMTAKSFAVGFRVEHPQELINEMQGRNHQVKNVLPAVVGPNCELSYHRWADEVKRGKGKLPVADYKLATDVGSPFEEDSSNEKKYGRRGCFSFCMCPGGQVVLTSTDSSELCINGMSFSNRASRWANAALVVSVSTSDFLALGCNIGPLAGVDFQALDFLHPTSAFSYNWQRVIEKEAAVRGGGNFVAPVQTVTDFLDDQLCGDALPSSSYRLGVKAAFLHDLLPSYLTESLKKALLSFEQQLPGFIDKRALLHGVETRTSSPVRIERSKETFESTSLAGLYPIGEGAGHAGGIVSAAVDGMHVGLALAKQLNPPRL